MVLIEDVRQRGSRVDRLAVDRGDHITGGEPRTGGRAARNHLSDHGARTTSGVVDTDTEERCRTDVHRRRPAAALNLPGDGHRLVNRDHETLPAAQVVVVGCGGVQADHLVGGVDSGPTGVAGPYAGVDLDQPIERLRAAGQGVGRRHRLVQRDDAAVHRTGRSADTTGVAQRDDRYADGDRSEVADIGGLQSASGELHYRDVMPAVKADHRARKGLTVADGPHGQVRSAGDYVVVGKHRTGTAHTAGPGATAPSVS